MTTFHRLEIKRPDGTLIFSDDFVKESGPTWPLEYIAGDYEVFIDGELVMTKSLGSHPQVCYGCGRQIEQFVARYTGSEGADPPKYWHWSCHEKWLNDAKESLRKGASRANIALDKLRRLLK